MPKRFAKLVRFVRPKRRWLRFRFRTLFVLVVIVGQTLGWLAWKGGRQRTQRAVMAAIFVHGGVFARRELVPGAANWKQQLFGDDLDGPISGITFMDASASDTELCHIAAIDSLEYVCVHGADVTDAGLAKLKTLPHLKLLILRGTNVTDAGLAELRPLVKLEILDLTGTKVTAAGIAELQRALPNCKITR